MTCQSEAIEQERRAILVGLGPSVNRTPRPVERAQLVDMVPRTRYTRQGNNEQPPRVGHGPSVYRIPGPVERDQLVDMMPRTRFVLCNAADEYTHV